MKIDFLRVFEDIKENDILFGGKTNLAIQKNVYPLINFADENAVNAYKYLLVQFEFYIFHVCHCYDQIIGGESDSTLSDAGYDFNELASAKEAIRKYGRHFNKAIYLYLANAKIGSVARAIEKIVGGQDLSGIPKEIIEAATRRIAYSERGMLVNER